MRKNKKPIYTADLETDPFEYERGPKAFLAGYFDGSKLTHFWGAKCVEKMMEAFYEMEPGIIYMHNGGRFDVLGFCMPFILGHPMRVINNRIVKATLPCRTGHHEIRDSYALLPFRLADYKGKTQKLDIDITKLERKVRQKHKKEIIEYWGNDCIALFELVTRFIAAFGLELTVGTTAMKQLKTFHTFEILSEGSDKDIRDRYFMGGRVDVLRSGIIKGKFKLYDVNSMYPYVMANYQHPVSNGISYGKRITKDTQFVSVIGSNNRAFPVRKKDGGLDYTCEYGEFHVSIHEFRTAEELGIFVPERITRTLDFFETNSFSEFVTSFYEGRKQAKLDGDEVQAMFLKYILNSAYGKFAQAPDNYKEWAITASPDHSPGNEWTLRTMMNLNLLERNQYSVWTKPSINATRFNVATGASITGAARSVLMRAIATAKKPIYCDTDSLLCERLSLDVDASKLGAWKLEAEIDTAAIAGKKLYALFKDGKLVKKAHKGFKITGQQILDVCNGKEVVSYNDAPTFKLDGSCRFVHRRVRMTV